MRSNCWGLKGQIYNISPSWMLAKCSVSGGRGLFKIKNKEENPSEEDPGVTGYYDNQLHPA